MPQDAALPDHLDLAWSDPQLEQALRAMLNGDPQPALALLGTVPKDADRRELYAGVLGEGGQSQLPPLEALAERNPDNPDGWLLLGSALASAAWTARGAAVIEMTSDEQIDGLVRLGKQAREALHRAAELAPTDAAPWSQILRCTLGAPDDDDDCERAFTEVARRAPEMYQANMTRLSSLTAKWYGSQKQALAFARDRTRDLPSGHPLHALIALAHIEGYLEVVTRDNMFGRVWGVLRYWNKRVRAELDAASDRMLSGTAQFAGHPNSMAAHQVFAAAYRQVSEDPQRCRAHLERSGDRPMQWPWAYFGEHTEEFAAARALAGLVP